MHCCRNGKCSPYVILVWQVIFDFFFFFTFACLFKELLYTCNTIHNLTSLLLGFFCWSSPTAHPVKGRKQGMRFSAVLIWKSCENLCSFTNVCAEKKLDRLGRGTGTEREKNGRRWKRKKTSQAGLVNCTGLETDAQPQWRYLSRPWKSFWFEGKGYRNISGGRREIEEMAETEMRGRGTAK